MRVDLANWGQIKGQTGGGPSGANIPMPQGQRPHGESQPLEAENIQKLSAIEQQTAKKWEGIFQGFGRTLNEWDKQANALSLKKLEGHLQTSMLKFRMGLAKEFQGLTDDEMKPKNVMQLIPERVDQFLTDFEKSDEVAQILENDDVNRFWQAGRATAANRFVEMALPAWQTDFSNRETAATNNFEEQISTANASVGISGIWMQSDGLDQDLLMEVSGSTEEELGNPEDLKAAAKLAENDYKAYLKESGKPQIVIDQMVFEAQRKSEHNYLALLKTFPEGSLDDVLPKSIEDWRKAFPHADKLEIFAVYNSIRGTRIKSEQKEMLTALEKFYMDEHDPLKAMRRLENMPDTLEGMKQYAKKGNHLSEQEKDILALTPHNFDKYRIKLLKGIKVLEKAKTKVVKEDRDALLQAMEESLTNVSSEVPATADAALEKENLVWNKLRHKKAWQGLSLVEQEEYTTQIALAATYGSVLGPLISQIDVSNIRSIASVNAMMDLLDPNDVKPKQLILNLRKIITEKKDKTALDNMFLNGTINEKAITIHGKMNVNARARLRAWTDAYHSSPAAVIRASLAGAHALKSVSVGQEDLEGNIVLNAIKLLQIQGHIEETTIEGESLPKDLEGELQTQINQKLGLDDEVHTTLSSENITAFYTYFTKLKDAFLGGGGQALTREERVIGENLWNKFVLDNVPAKAHAAWQLQETNKMIQNGQLEPNVKHAEIQNAVALTMALSDEKRTEALMAKLLSMNPAMNINGHPIDTAAKLKSVVNLLTTADVTHSTGWWLTDGFTDAMRKDYLAFVTVGTNSQPIPDDSAWNKMLFNEFAKLDSSLFGWEFFADAPSFLHRWMIDQHKTNTSAFSGSNPLTTGYRKDGLNELVLGHLAMSNWETPDDIREITQAYMGQLTQREVVIPVSDHHVIRFPKEFVPKKYQGRFSPSEYSFAIDQLITEKVLDGTFTTKASLQPKDKAKIQALNALLTDGGVLGKDFFIAPEQQKDGTFAFKFFITSENKTGFVNSFIMMDPNSSRDNPQPLKLDFNEVFERAALRDTLVLARNAGAVLPGSYPLTLNKGYGDYENVTAIEGGAVVALKEGKLFSKPIPSDESVQTKDVLTALIAADALYYERLGKESEDWKKKRGYHFANRGRADMWEQVLKDAPKSFQGYNSLNKYISDQFKQMDAEYSKKFINTRKAGLMEQVKRVWGYGPMNAEATNPYVELKKGPTRTVQEVLEDEIGMSVEQAAKDYEAAIAAHIVDFLGLQRWVPELGVSLVNAITEKPRLPEERALQTDPAHNDPPRGSEPEGGNTYAPVIRSSMQNAVLGGSETFGTGGGSLTTSDAGPPDENQETIEAYDWPPLGGGGPSHIVEGRRELIKPRPDEPIRKRLETEPRPETIAALEGNRGPWMDTRSDLTITEDDRIRQIEERKKSSSIPEVTNVKPDAEGTIEHTVIRGDTVGELANRYGVTVKQIKDANEWMTNEHEIEVDDVIKIPPRLKVPSRNPSKKFRALISKQFNKKDI